MPTSAQYDDELLKVHLAQAAVVLPGPDYYAVLRWIHRIVKPNTYVEIGIRQGDSLCCALPDTLCVGIDPEPALTGSLPPDARLFAVPSDDFFAAHKLSEVLGTPSFALAFIDGLHLFEQALRDFINLEAFADRGSIVMLHDCIPLDAVTSSRTRSTHFYSGDTWKLPFCLKQHRPDLAIKTIRTGPTGLCLVGNLDNQSRTLPSGFKSYLEKYVPLTFVDYQAHKTEMPETVANTPEAVAACLADLAQPGCGR